MGNSVEVAWTRGTLVHLRVLTATADGESSSGSLGGEPDTYGNPGLCCLVTLQPCRDFAQFPLRTWCVNESRCTLKTWRSRCNSVLHQEYVVTFDSVRPIFEYNRTWDFKTYRAQQHSVITLREQMQRIGVWVNELEKMRARQPCGILEVSGIE